MGFLKHLLIFVSFIASNIVLLALGLSENQTALPGELIHAEYCTRDYECGTGCGSYLTSSSCSCHPACEIFRDCCYNSLEQAKRCIKTNDTEQFISEVLPWVKDYFRCTTDVISNTKYWMISKCPDSWKGSNECDVIGNDTDVFVGRLEDNLSGIPVVTRNGLTYRNIYCALCHGEDLSGLTPWSFDADDCEDNELFETATNASTKDLIQLLRDNCKSVSFLPPRDHKHYSLSVIPCREITDDVIDQCDDSTTSVDIQFNCATIAAPISIGGNNFKNTFCVECFYSSRTNIEYEIKERCTVERAETVRPTFFQPLPCCPNPGIQGPGPEPPPPPLVPISITFSFGSQSGGVSVKKNDKVVQETSKTCDVGLVFDPLESKCKQLSCPDGFILRDLLCLQLPDIARNYSAEFNHFAIEIKAQSMRFGKKSCLKDLDSTFNCLPAELVTLLYANMQHFNVSCRLVMNGQLVVETNTSSLDIIDSLLTRTDGRADLQSDTCKHIDMIELSAYCTSSFDEPFLQCDTEWLNETQWIRSDNISDGISLNNSTEAIDLSQLQIRHLYQISSTISNLSSEDIFVKRCEISTCPILILDSTHFIPSENDPKVLLYAENISIQFTPDMYTELENGSIEVCNFLTIVGNVTHFSFLPRYSSVQAILSTVGIVLSLLALLITLFSYCIFPALRTRLENIAIMTLCGCLIVAQLLFLFAGITTTNPIVCSLVSGLGHFFWLAAFSSTSVLGFLLSKTFSFRNQTLRTGSPSTRNTCFVVLHCIMFPSLISGTLLTLHYIDEDGRYGIVYGSTSGCWIGGPMVNLYAFGIPVAVSLFINAILFFCITLSICIQMKKSKRIRKKKRQFRETTIYFKIFIILGLTWISGFVAALFDQPWLWYLFIIFTSLQGVFIFLAFTVKSQIWRMWRKRLGLDRRPNIISSQVDTVSGRSTVRLNMSEYKTNHSN